VIGPVAENDFFAVGEKRAFLLSCRLEPVRYKDDFFERLVA